MAVSSAAPAALPAGQGDSDETEFEPVTPVASPPAEPDKSDETQFSPMTPVTGGDTSKGKGEDQPTTTVGSPDPVSQQAVPLPEGMKIGKYKIIKCLGFGGFGITYKVVSDNGIDHVLKESYPAKFMVRDPKTWDLTVRSESGGLIWNVQESFRKEAEILNRSKHANVVSIADKVKAHNTLYYVMEYVPGCSLKELKKKYDEEQKNFSEKEICDILRQMLKALRCLHQSAQVLHRDIKPANILANGDSYKLIDFGIACYMNDLEHESFKGSPGFAAPEQMPPKEQRANMTEDDVRKWMGKLGPYTDIYSLAATVYYLITGEKFTPDEKHLEDVRNIPGYSTPLLLSLQHALNPDFTKRTQSAEAWEHELDEEQRRAVEIAEKLRQDKEKRDDFVKELETRVLHNRDISSDQIFKLERILDEDPRCSFVYGCILLYRERNLSKALKVARDAVKAGDTKAMQLLGNCILLESYECRNVNLRGLWSARSLFVKAGDQYRAGLCVKSMISICLYRLLAFLFGMLSLHNLYLLLSIKGEDSNLQELRQKKKQVFALQFLFTLLTLGVGFLFVWVPAIIEAFTVTKRFKPCMDEALFNKQ